MGRLLLSQFFKRPWSFVQDLRRDEIRGWWWWWWCKSYTTREGLIYTRCFLKCCFKLLL